MTRLPTFGSDKSFHESVIPGTAQEGYGRILEASGFSVGGRVVVIPEAFSEPRFAIQNPAPFVCDSKMVAERLGADFFGQAHDCLFVYESGHAIAVNHDSVIWWAQARCT